MPRPYVGITGATTKEEIDLINEEFRNAGFDSVRSTHEPMIGFLASNKTVNKIPITDPMHASRYPKIEELGSLLEHARKKGLFTTVHYNTKEPETLGDQLNRLMKRYFYYGFCDTVQLNVVWPKIEELQKLEVPLNMIFQANSRSMEGLAPNEYAEKLSKYRSYIKYALLDCSGGLGKELDADKLFPYYTEIKKIMPELTIGVAGGLSGDNAKSTLENVFARINTKDFSTDSEGKVRAEDNQEVSREKIRHNLLEQSAFFNHKL